MMLAEGWGGVEGWRGGGLIDWCVYVFDYYFLPKVHLWRADCRGILLDRGSARRSAVTDRLEEECVCVWEEIYRVRPG